MLRIEGLTFRQEVVKNWIEMAARESRAFRLALDGKGKHGGDELKAPVPRGKEPILTPPSQELL